MIRAPLRMTLKMLEPEVTHLFSQGSRTRITMLLIILILIAILREKGWPENVPIVEIYPQLAHRPFRHATGVRGLIPSNLYRLLFLFVLWSKCGNRTGQSNSSIVQPPEPSISFAVLPRGLLISILGDVWMRSVYKVEPIHSNWPPIFEEVISRPPILDQQCDDAPEQLNRNGSLWRFDNIWLGMRLESSATTNKQCKQSHGPVMVDVGWFDRDLLLPGPCWDSVVWLQ